MPKCYDHRYKRTDTGASTDYKPIADYWRDKGCIVVDMEVS